MKHLKVTSVLLSVAMCMTMAVTPVMADETAPEQSQTTEETQEKEPEEQEAAPSNEDEKEAETVKGQLPEEKEQTEAEDAYLAKGKCGKKVKWTLDKKGTLKITGKGAMKDYKHVGEDYATSDAPWIKYSSKIKKVIISKGVTAVGTRAFVKCENLTSVSLPKSLKSIKESAFYGCSGLKKVSIPGKVRTIGASAFATCTALENINIPNGVKTISGAAFAATSITGITIPKSVKTIESYAFSECRALKSITIPASVEVIQHGVFNACSSLETVNIPIAGLSFLGADAFKDCTSLTKIQVPLSVTELGKNTFEGCKNLVEASIDSDLYAASTATFKDCSPSLKISGYDYVPVNFVSRQGDLEYKVTFPEIDGNGRVSVIAYNPDAENLVVPNEITIVKNEKSVTYKVTRIERSYFLGSDENMMLKSVVIGSNVTSIADNAFTLCTSLESVTGGAKLQTIGSCAFAACVKLKVFNISSTSLKKIGAYAFSSDKALTTLQIRKTTKLTKAGVKDSLKSSSVKTVKVKKSKVKKYKKIFTKKNCGKKVTVKK